MLKLLLRSLAVLLCLGAAPSFAQDGQEGAISFRHKHPDPSLEGPPIFFYAELSPDEESSVVHSPGKGRVDFILERDTMKLSWKVTFSGLTSPAQTVAIHGPQTPGGNAGILIDLAPDLKKATSGTYEGSYDLTEGDLSYLVMDRMYVNITTTKYEEGELRAHIRRIRPEKAPAVAAVTN